MKLSERERKVLTNRLIEWIQEMNKQTGGTGIVIGISGGKDSSVVAALSCEAVGRENVFGVLMPDGHQRDIADAYEICEHLGISYSEIDISPMTQAFYRSIETSALVESMSKTTTLNLPARVRMTLLYGVSQSIEGSRVINTSNLSEDWVGYATIYGDTAGAYSPLATLTTDEVIQVGQTLQIPEKFLVKAPADGLTGKEDEEILGFTYETLNRYIREGIIEDDHIKETIDRMHRLSRFKFKPIPIYHSGLPILADDIEKIYQS